MTPPVILRCRARYGQDHCIEIRAADRTLREAHDCVGWCPLLREVITWEGDLLDREAEWER